MSFRIKALEAASFKTLWAMDHATLAKHRGRRCVATASPGFPCRVSLLDAEVGETVLLVNYEHLSGRSPFRAAHAIYIRENAVTATPPAGTVPALFLHRLLSVRAYDADQMLIAAEVAPGTGLKDAIAALFADPAAAFLHIDNAKPGCFAARVDRA